MTRYFSLGQNEPHNILYVSRTVSLAVFPLRWAGGAVSVRSTWRRRTLRGVQSAGGGYTGAARRGLPCVQVGNDMYEMTKDKFYTWV